MSLWGWLLLLLLLLLTAAVGMGTARRRCDLLLCVPVGVTVSAVGDLLPSMGLRGGAVRGRARCFMVPRHTLRAVALLWFAGVPCLIL